MSTTTPTPPPDTDLVRWSRVDSESWKSNIFTLLRVYQKVDRMHSMHLKHFDSELKQGWLTNSRTTEITNVWVSNYIRYRNRSDIEEVSLSDSWQNIRTMNYFEKINQRAVPWRGGWTGRGPEPRRSCQTEHFGRVWCSGGCVSVWSCPEGSAAGCPQTSSAAGITSHRDRMCRVNFIYILYIHTYMQTHIQSRQTDSSPAT